MSDSEANTPEKEEPQAPGEDPNADSPPDSKVILSCRHCGTKNRFPLEKAVYAPEKLFCGSCKKDLLIHGEEPLEGLSGRAYEHPLDREALDALEKIPGIDTLLRKLVSESFERASRIYHLSSYVQCHEKQLPHIYDLFLTAVRRLDVDTVPDLFIAQDPSVNAYIYGVHQPFLCVSSGLIELMDEEEILSIFAHELGHWQCDHVLYKMAGSILAEMAGSLALYTFGLGALAMIPIRLALLKWDRCAELTADRASLLAVRNPRIVIRALMKVAGGSRNVYNQMNLEQFMEQANRLRQMEQDNLLNRLFSILQVLNRSHPFPIWRAAELIDWAEQGQYIPILAGNYVTRQQIETQVCESCLERYPQDAPRCPYCGFSPDDKKRPPVEGEGEGLEGIGRNIQEVIDQGAGWLRNLFGEGGNPPKKQ